MTDRQAEVIALLSRPATHGGAAVEIVETHAALVFLAGGTALKMKRAVRYDYLDFTAVETRRAMLERELELNRPAAPEIYRDVVAVTEGPEGLRIGGDGPAVDWVLRMARFDAADELSAMADRGALDTRLAFRLGRAVAELHRHAPVRIADGAALTGEIVAELEAAFATMEDALGARRTGELAAAIGRAQAAQAPLLARRGARGHVRRCHGDLHLGNMVMIGDRPVPFDALEFDERLATCDVAYDLAFLLMDMLHRGLRAEANTAFAAWAAAMCGTEDAGIAALPLFLALRAGIRAMVLVQTDRAADRPGRSDAEARRYLGEALAHLAPPAPRLVAIGGRSGTGKTTMARRLAPCLGPGIGALHLASDVERKTMLGVDPLAPLPAEAYGAAVSRRLYARLLARAETALAAGSPVVIDATFLERGPRAEVADLAARRGLRLDGLWLEAPEATLLARVVARRGDASDADAAVVAGQPAVTDPGPGWRRIDARGCAGAVVARLAGALDLAF